MAVGSLNLGCSIETFLAEYWQRKPKVIRGALKGQQFPLEADELAGLACEPLAETRLIQGPDASGQWQLEHGPLPENRFAELGHRNWTLLVQDVDKLVGEVGDLLELFAFLPRWRIDDIMVSFAAPGGSVGPHVDQYDVFLWQLEGHRRWQFHTQVRDYTERVADCPLDMLAEFQPDQEAVLEPGDILYLPPGLAHHGVAEDRCMTASIGMRAPGADELIVDFAEEVASRLVESVRYRDPNLQPSSNPSCVDTDAIERARDLMIQHLPLQDNTLFRQWFGQFVTRYRSSQQVAPPPKEVTTEQLAGWVEKDAAVFYPNPWTRAVCVEGVRGLFINGQLLEMEASVAQAFADGQPLSCSEVARSPAALKGVLLELINAGHWVVDID